MGSSRVSRSVYVGQLRRAFLLRVHPDRFRRHGAAVQSNQAKLVAAVGERLNAQDFQRYVGNHAAHLSATSSRSHAEYSYFLEKRDGSLLKDTLRLGGTPFDILTNIAQALEASGAAVSSPPPPSLEGDEERFTCPGFMADANANAASSDHPLRDVMNRYQHQGVERDLRSYQGRNLIRFLSTLDRSYVEERKMMRLAASTAALVARRLYSFQSIDGTRTGWSSESFNQVLNSLIHLHEEHGSRLPESFYPLRLVYSSDDLQGSYDFYGGEVFLHPGMTPSQWLPVLRAVTADSIGFFRRRRLLLHERQALLQEILGVRISKGHSCSSFDFHRCIEQYATSVDADAIARHRDATNSTRNSNSVVKATKMHIVVESPQASRMTRVTKTGNIQINYQMDFEQLGRTLRRLEASAMEATQRHSEAEERYAEVVRQAQWNLGIQRIRKAGHVSFDEAVGCVLRLLKRSDVGGSGSGSDEASNPLEPLAGMSITIVGNGNLCYISDDGSLMLPCDFLC